MHQTNNAIANIFLTMAERLQQDGANPYRVRAYRRASATLGSLQEDIAKIALSIGNGCAVFDVYLISGDVKFVDASHLRILSANEESLK